MNQSDIEKVVDAFCGVPPKPPDIAPLASPEEDAADVAETTAVAWIEVGKLHEQTQRQSVESRQYLDEYESEEQ